jgi:hypothetical protein
MARLNHFVHAYWYGLRWPHFARMLAILGFGLFLLGGGVVRLMGPSLPDQPQRLELDAVMNLLGQPSPRHVTFEARLDFSKKIYETGWVPYWGNCPPSEIRRLPPGDAGALDRLVGCRVSVAGPLKPAGRVGTEEQGRRTLAEVPGTGGRLWPRSPFRSPRDSGRARLRRRSRAPTRSPSRSRPSRRTAGPRRSGGRTPRHRPRCHGIRIGAGGERPTHADRIAAEHSVDQAGVEVASRHRAIIAPRIALELGRPAGESQHRCAG